MKGPILITPSDADDLPDLQPGEEVECVIVPQKFVVLRRVHVQELLLTLVRLQIGNHVEVPFELVTVDGYYRLTGLDNPDLQKRLGTAGAAVAPHNTIALSPAVDVVCLLRNDGAVSVRPRVALLVQEEV